MSWIPNLLVQFSVLFIPPEPVSKKGKFELAEGIRLSSALCFVKVGVP
jgi:hypothetical protein